MKRREAIKKAIKATLIQSIILYIAITLFFGFVEFDLSYIPVNTWKGLTSINHWSPLERAAALFGCCFYWAFSVFLRAMYIKDKL